MKPNLSFRRFLEDEENRTAHLDALQDELGIDPKHLKDTPQVASFFSLGGDTFNLGSYKIIDYKYGQDGKPTHAVVKMIYDPNGNRRRYKNDGEDKTRVQDYDDGKTYLVPIEDLQALMTQGLDQAGAGAPMGAPPAGPPM